MEEKKQNKENSVINRYIFEFKIKFQDDDEDDEDSDDDLLMQEYAKIKEQKELEEKKKVNI